MEMFVARSIGFVFPFENRAPGIEKNFALSSIVGTGFFPFYVPTRSESQLNGNQATLLKIIRGSISYG